MDKYIDKLIDSKWFMQFISLILALLLFDSVYDINKTLNSVNVPGEQDTETIQDVPVKAYYDTENLVVTGIPETVSVKLEGPKIVLQQAKTLKNFEVYIDLSEAEIGTHQVEIKIKDLSEKIKATIEPKVASVSVQEKVTQEFKVEAEFNSSLIEAGYIASAPEVEPNKVKITGAKDVIEKISFVKATVDIKGPIKEKISREATVLVFDQELNKLDVLVEPAVVNVSIPVKASSKSVPISIVRKGSPPEGVEIESISLDKNEATILGDETTLGETQDVRVEVDLSKIDRNTELELPVIISDGVVEVSPQTVKVFVRVKTEENKTFSDLPIKTKGLAEQYEVDIKDPSNGTVNLTVTGPINIVKALSSEDFSLLLDLSDLDEGDHDVDIVVSGPDSVTWKLARASAKISITQKEV
ncbi:YbbR-like domain-containing protein [Cytobacillus spongiae]|uniref:CdaR family protein n=1 Tax=Cytobacillus spongiae TaxID=2901381 RepID=UPI001F33EDE8|nr:CdaR family protein [Cytobacillus spongiae]UII56122.1 YbbR-like domain-containing protein [Cytobacillus spongiae]